MGETKHNGRRVLVIGGGIGASRRRSRSRAGIRVKLLEQADRIGEIGAGIQLAANAFNALDALVSARPRAAGRCSPTGCN